MAALGLAAPVAASSVLSGVSILGTLDSGSVYSDRAQYEVLPTAQGTQMNVQLNGLWSAVGTRSATPVNWSTNDTISFTVTNHESRDVKLGIRVDATPVITDWSRIEQSVFSLRAGETRRFVFDLNPDAARQAGMRAVSPLVTTPHQRLIATKTLNLSNVYSWLVFLNENSTAQLTITNLEVLKTQRTMSGIVDSFGQHAQGTWTGKVASSSSLRADVADELIDLNANPGPGGLTGTTAIPPQTGTGRWRTVRLASGKWYLVHPSGRVFWSYGMTTVRPIYSTTVSGRESMFAGLPSQGGDTSQFYSWVRDSQGVDRLTFSHHAYNQYLKYGSTWRTDFGTRALARLKSWGFNTIGPWGEPSMVLRADMPYTLSISTDTFPTRLSTPFAYWTKLPDPFSTSFGSWLVSKMRSELNGHTGKTNLMGVFVDGEPSWGLMDNLNTRYQVALAALNAHSSQPAKIAFLRSLQAKYRRIGNLNRVWGTSYSSWSAMSAQNIASNLVVTARSEPDMRKFVYDFAYVYYKKVKDSLAAAGNTSLYLGSRDAWATPESRAAAMNFVDVYSATIYRNPENVDWSFSESTRPVLIAEFSFGANDRGSFHPGPIGTADQADRAAKMQAYMSAAVRAPKVVGAHWFEYYDQPLTGRAQDGENYNVGFVSVTDRPHEEMVDAARSIGAALYATRGR